MNLEERRIQVLHQYDILDSEPEETFDNLAKLASHICNTSAAQVNFIDKNRQWTKANIGWGSSEIQRELSFCTHTISSKGKFMIVPDSHKDERFKNNPIITGDPPLRFYAGVTLESINEYPLGTLCVFDSEPKTLSDEDLEALDIIADEVEAHLKLRLGQDQLKEILNQENRLNKKIISSLPINFFMYNSEGEIARWNENVKKTTGYTDNEIKQMKPEDYFEGGDRRKVEKKIKEALKGKELIFEAELLKKDGYTAPFVFGMSRFEMNDEEYLIGTAQDITKQKETQHKLEELLDLFGRFVPREFIRYLSEEGLTSVRLGDQTEENITILFADIRSFSTISESFSAENNFKFLNAFLKRIGPPIRSHKGIIDKFLGDGVMALFPRKPVDAVRASIEMQKNINQYNDERVKKNREPIHFSIGLHYGNVQLGIIGDDDRYQVTAISDDVNQTFRIEELAKEYDAPLLVSEELYKRLDKKSRYHFRQLGKLQVKGLEKAVAIYEIINGDFSQQGELKKKLKEVFNEGIQNFYEEQFADATQKFSQVLKENPDDVAARIYLNKATSKL